MNAAIKILEEIGQNTSIKEHDSLVEMLGSMDLKEGSIENVGLKTHEFVCALLPARDKDDKDDKDDNDNGDSDGKEE